MAQHIFCVRHGRTAWNAVGKFQGLSDIPLDDVGREQVAASAALLRDERIDRAIASDLVRAAETARIIVGERPLELTYDSSWRERGFGKWEGLTWPEITALHDGLSGSSSIDVRTVQPEEGEPFEEVKARVAAAFHAFTSSLAPHENGLIVTHAGILHALLDVLFGGDREARSIPTAGIIRLEMRGGFAMAAEEIAPVR